MSLKDIFKKHQPLPTGFHTFRGQMPDGSNYRIHLRIDRDGKGILVINASKVIHLNQTGAEFSKLIIDGKSDDESAKIISRRYRVNKKQALADFQKFKEKIVCLAGSDVCPVSALDFERIDPFTTPVAAPYRMDLALTHRCDLNCGHCYAGGPRETKEMDADSWKKVIDKLFETGIPHLCFTGGEATLRQDLPELVAHAEDLGLVTGLLTNGCALADAAYVKTLLASGLDHCQITIESHDPAIHNAMTGGKNFERTVSGIKNAVAAGLYTVTNTTITRKNMDTLKDTIGFIHSLGVQRFAMNGIIRSGRSQAGQDSLSAKELCDRLQIVKDAASDTGMKFIWYTPTRYCDVDPVEMGLGMKRCTAGQYNMCVEPDGSVLPCQSYFESVGNILADPWEKIWEHPLLKKLRERGWIPDECKECEELSVCGGGCPLEYSGKETLCTESLSNF